MFSAARQLLLLATFIVLAGAPGLLADFQPVWKIGLDEDPFQSGYNATDEFASENYLNDARPGKVTRLPGDPLYNAGSNPTADWRQWGRNGVTSKHLTSGEREHAVAVARPLLTH